MASSIPVVPYLSPQHVYLHWSQVLQSIHGPWQRSMGVLFITMHILGSILFFLSFFLSLSCFEMRTLQVSCFFCGFRFCDFLSYTSSVLTHIPLHSLSSHSKWSANACAAPSECGRVLKSCICPSFLFLGPVREKKALVLFSTTKEKVRPPWDLSFYGDGRGLRERKHSRESSGKIWSLCRGRCDTSFGGAERNMGCSCLKEFDLQPERSLSSLPHPEVFLSADNVTGVGQ